MSLAAIVGALVLVTGTVVDPTGAPLPNVHVIYRAESDASGRFFFSSKNPEEAGELRTKSDGTFTLNVVEGTYDICVMADTFTPRCAKFRIASNRSRLKPFKLNFDPLTKMVE